MILEGIVTTIDADARNAHVAAMGVTVDADAAWRLDQFVLRPFQSSSTFVNLRRDRAGVFHVTDDVLLLSQAVTGKWPTPPVTRLIDNFPVPRLADACRWYAFHITQLDATEPRARMHCGVVQGGCDRDFVGFHRARHAVLELAILATRVSLMSKSELLSAVRPWQAMVDKTAGPAERQAFRLLMDYVRDYYRMAGQGDAGGNPCVGSPEAPSQNRRGATEKTG